MKAFSEGTLYLCVVFAVHIICTAEDIVDYYEDLITNLTESALEYEAPEDARMYAAEDTTIRDPFHTLNSNLKLSMCKVIWIVFVLSVGSVLIVPVLISQLHYAETLVDCYEKLIINTRVNALSYEHSEDASRYRPTNASIIIDYGSYDFVIIGAGSTGSVIASRLSEVNEWRILLLEAGTFSNNATEIPALYSLNVFSDYNWGFRTIPQTTACLGAENSQCLLPRGRGVGGTTLINGLIYSRGSPEDFNKWAKVVGDASWSYANVLEYFKKSEDFHQTDSDATVDWDYHGTNGNLYVEHHNPAIQLKEVFLKANEALGYNVTDSNGRYQTGPSICQYNTRNGKRLDQGNAFITPVMSRENLEVLTESYVTKIEINNEIKEATGVIFTNGGRLYRVAANKEVILSAGAISTPQILMLSGIGHREHLEDVGVPVVEDLPVGSTLRDHVGAYGIQFTSNMSRITTEIREKIEQYILGFGDLTTNTLSHVYGFYKLASESPDIEIVIDLTSTASIVGKRFLNWNDVTWDTLWADNNLNSSFYITVLLLHPKSIGTVRLNSSNPFDYPLIDSNYLSDDNNTDINTMYEAIQFAMMLVNTSAFKKIEAELAIRPLPACKEFESLSKDYWFCFIRQTTLGVYHPVGSCPSGTDPTNAVVDAELRVFGVDKFRVADASVFPVTLAAHPNAACTMLGEKISDTIKTTYNVT